jgi:hypothetical protein
MCQILVTRLGKQTTSPTLLLKLGEVAAERAL